MRRSLLSILVLTLVLGATSTPSLASPRVAQNATPAPPPPGLDQVVAVAAGGGHFLALRIDGTVWGWGTNSDWELGVTTPAGAAGSLTPVRATGLDQVRGLATGTDHGLALRADGSVWAWGKNDHGQVGVRQGENCPNHPRPCVQAPVPVPGLSGMKAVAASENSSFAVGADGTVWAWGDNGRGQLGTGSEADGLSPTRVEGVADIVSISTESPHVVALRGDGTVWAWGGNDEQTTPMLIPGLGGVAAVAAGLSRNLALTADGTVWAWGERGAPAPVVVVGLSPMTAIAGGGRLSGGVAADGTVWVWGTSASATGTPTQVEDFNDIIAINMGSGQNLGLKADGTVWTWRQNSPPRPVRAPTEGTLTP